MSKQKESPPREMRREEEAAFHTEESPSGAGDGLLHLWCLRSIKRPLKGLTALDRFDRCRPGNNEKKK